MSGGSLRWRERRSMLRPAEPIVTSQYDVVELDSDAIAKRFVTDHHYSATYPAARFRFGLHRGGDLVGAAVFSHPMRDAVLAPFGELPAVELGRFVLLDEVPGNGETWFLARAFELLHGRVRGVVSHSDPTPRQTLDGRVVLPGHVGTIYQAHNARYWGRTRARWLLLLPDGSVLSERAVAKIKARHQGWKYAASQLERHGADPLAGDEDGASWLGLWVPRLTRRVRHPGNHRYLWGLDQNTRRLLPAGPDLPFPKKVT